VNIRNWNKAKLILKQVYLDYSATTPLAPEVNEAMYLWGKSETGNPSSPHRYGQKIKFQLEEVRDTIAEFLGCKSKEGVFTSGGTESNNLALTGVADNYRSQGKHIIISAVEHPSVLNCAEHLETRGYEITRIKPDNNGKLNVDDFRNAIRQDTILISAMYVNNETGVIHPVKEIGALCKEKNIPFHCDVVQAFGKLIFTIDGIQADLISISAHKIYGPKGIGTLIIREGTLVSNLFFGGGQEANRRPGTENMTGIIGFGAAVNLLKKYNNDYKNTLVLRSHFEENLKRVIPEIEIIGEKSERSPFISCIAFPGFDNQSLLLNLDMAGIAVSVGSACSSGSIRQSHVLKAMGLPDRIINSAIRFSFGRLTEKDGMDYTIDQLNKITKRIQKSN
jgi:cysteine desulfurase